jgi:hypothetical protein
VLKKVSFEILVRSNGNQMKIHWHFWNVAKQVEIPKYCLVNAYANSLTTQLEILVVSRN